MMNVVSDTFATRMFVRRIAEDQINATMCGWCLATTQLLMNTDLRSDIRVYALSSPRDLGRPMELIAAEAVLVRPRAPPCMSISSGNFDPATMMTRHAYGQAVNTS